MARLALLVLLATAGCDDTVYESHVPSGGGEDPYTPDWAGVQQVMENHCYVCHSAAGGNAVVLPDAIIADVESGAGALVVAGSPDESKLWRVLSGELDPDQDQTGAMPFGSPGLPYSESWPVYFWIRDGAVIE